MSQTVDLPDGSSIEFPDGMSAAAINAAISAHLTPQMSGAGRLPAMAASALGKGLATGVGLVGDIGAQTAAASNRLKQSGQAIPTALGILGDKLNPFKSFPTSRTLVGAGQKIGAFNRPDLAPQTSGESYLQAGAQGLGSALPMAALGPASALSVAASGVGSGLAVNAGQRNFPETMAKHPIAAPLAFGLAGGIGGGAVGNLAQRGINSVAGNVSPLAQAYDTAGIDKTLAGDVTGNRTLQWLQATGAKLPGGGGIAKASNEAVNQFGQSIESTAATLGKSTSLQDAGQALQNEGSAWLERFKGVNKANWNAVDNLIPSDLQVPVDEYRAALNNISSTMSQAKETAKSLQSGLTGKLFDSLQVDAPNGTLPWGDLKAIRSRIGEMLSDPNLPARDAGTAELKQLYGALTGDMEYGAAAQGPQAQQAFSAAVNYTRNGHQFIDDVLSDIVKKGQTPERAAQGILSSAGRGSTRLDALQTEMPDATNELAAFKLRDMASANPGAQNSTGTAYSPSSFLTNWNKLSPEARETLYQNNPDISAKLDALATVAGTMKETASLSNTSNTGAFLSAKQILSTPTDAAVGGAAGYSAFGVPGAIAGAVGGATAPWVPGLTARALTASPWLTRYMSAQGNPTPLSWQALLAGVVPGNSLLNPQPSPQSSLLNPVQ